MKNLKINNNGPCYGNYRAKVLDNLDPLKLGRVKLEIYPILIGIEADFLPWATPAMPIFDGAGLNTGSFIVPKNDTMVYCFFENGDIYQPVFFAEATDGKKGLPTSREINYPNRKVWRTDSGIEVFIDDTEQEVYIYHPSTTDIKIDKSGNIDINGNKDISVIVKGNANISAIGNIIISGASVNINP